MDFGIWRFSFGHFDGCDAQRPDVCFVVVLALLEDLGRHPEGTADDAVLVAESGGELCRYLLMTSYSEVSDLDIASDVDEDVGSFDVSMDHFVLVKVAYAFEDDF